MIAVEARLPFWSRVEYATAATRGVGTPIPRWEFREGILRHIEGHREDYLYLNIPLRGDFEVACEVTGFGANPMHLVYGGIKAGLRWNRSFLDVTYSGRNQRSCYSIDPPFDDFQDLLSLSTGGQGPHAGPSSSTAGQGLEEPLPPGNDPWLAIHEEADGAWAACGT